MGKLKSKKTKQAGQAVVEYMLLLSLIIGAMGFMVNKLRDNADKIAAKSGAKLEKMLRTGDASPGIWTK